MEHERNENVRRVTRQSWKPSRPLLALHGFWKGAYSVIKILLAAVATVVAITAICLFAFIGLLADYLDSDAIMGSAEVVMGDFDQSGNSVMYYTDASGKIQVLQRLHADTNEDWATYDEIPKDLIFAAAAIEDHRFFEHQGVDWIPTIKACVSMFIGGREFGGSSITQQLIKNLYLEYDDSADDVTVQRKVLEIFRATEFEKRYDKKFIIEWYLNKIFLGEHCKGVKPAAARYFGKELEDLNTAECAALISITNNPSLFNPYRTGLDNYKGEQLTGAERNKRRREDTLFMMKQYGWLTDEEYAQALTDSENLTLKRGIDPEDRYADCMHEDCGYHGKVGTFTEKDNKNYCPKCNRVTTIGSDASRTVYSWFVDVVLEEVAQWFCEKGGVNWENADKDTKTDFKRLVCQSGLHIYTTLDMTVQKQVDKIYGNLDEIPDTDSIQQLQSGMVVIDNETGDIVAIAGGVGEKDVHDAYSKATDAKLQPGSSIKPLTVYAPGFELGVMNPGTVMEDLPMYYTNGKPFPRNADHQYYYTRTILGSVVDSLNAVAVNGIDMMGREYSFNFAKDKFRLSTLVKEYTNSAGKVFTDVDWAPLALGAPTVGITVRDMSTAYATFANNGVYRDSRTYTLIYDNDGILIHNNEQKSEQILTEKTVNYMNYCLDKAVEVGTGSYAEFDSYNYDICGKTGTTTGTKDRWFCGFTNKYTAAVWTGYEHPEAITGAPGNVACTLWRKVMEPLHRELQSEVLYDKNALVETNICIDCGKLATELCELDPRNMISNFSRVESVLLYPEDVPTESCDCHVEVRYCDEGYAVANERCPHAVTRALCKITKSQVDKIRQASTVGLWYYYCNEYYMYVVDNKLNPIPFFGLQGDRNQGMTVPYVVCDKH